ncbi:uncharacterized protein LOC110844975 [Folsomia candida]|uniref:Tolloid-like protein 2 n=1 Tax=Folsomia candida TaxID=158441 RepID=A0A226ESY5_FOLCA|nr:uncharacterized protein LOC110844975 [Folsomia candida]OXA59716.1 Tolloid-like protein 2 [Folsomia candida]
MNQILFFHLIISVVGHQVILASSQTVNIERSGRQIIGDESTPVPTSSAAPTDDGVLPDTTTNPLSTTKPPSVPPGSSVVLNPGDIRTVVSNRFGRTYNNEGRISTWQFYANNCILNVTCPCFRLPVSSNCLEAYLELRTGILYDAQKFCGINRPNGFASDTGEIRMKYKPSNERIPPGFTCFVACNPFGMPMMNPTIPIIGCPP